MRLSALAALMILTTAFLASCTQDQRAQVQDNGQRYYGRHVAMN